MMEAQKEATTAPRRARAGTRPVMEMETEMGIVGAGGSNRRLRQRRRLRVLEEMLAVLQL
jgi:hypothetical protein